MAEHSLAAAFLNSLRQSRLLQDEAFTRHLSELRAAGVNDKDAFALSDEFVRRGWITRWQADMLLDGKHRGFHLGKYRLLSQLGRGGMGTVYLAEHTLMRRRCAIKVLPPRKTADADSLARFEREAHAIASLNHRNIVRAFDFDREMDNETIVHFLVMEYVDGGSLQDKIVKEGPLPPATAVDLIRQAADGLSHAHSSGMIHRDIKPANLLIDNSGTLKILDLGLARFFNDTKQSEEAAKGSHYTGTVDYLAPEQAIDSEKADARSDIYALGCTLYFLLAGHCPFPDGTISQRLIDHQSREPKRLEQIRPEIKASLGDIVRKMLAKRPDDRYQTASELSQALLDWGQSNASNASRADAKRTPSLQPRSQSKPIKAETAFRPTAPNPFAGIPLEELSSKRGAGRSSEFDSEWSGLLRWPPTKKQLPALITAATAVALLVLFLGYQLISGGSSAPSGPAESKPVPRPVPPAPAPPPAAPAGPTGDFVVGPKGSFRTIGEGLAHVRQQGVGTARKAQRTITVEPGAYFERIIIDNSDYKFPNGVRLVSKGPAKAILAPPGDEPVIKLTGSPKAADRMTIDGFEIRADGKAVAIELGGSLVGTKFLNLAVRGFTQTGLNAKGITAFDVPDQRFTIERCAFLGGEGSVGIRLAPGNEACSHITIEKCRFVDPMKCGIVFRDQAIDIDIRSSAFYRLDDAIAFEGVGPEWRDVVIEGNSFHLDGRGIVFRSPFSTKSKGFAFRNNVFSKLTGYECTADGKFEVPSFLKALASNGIAKNRTTREKGAAPGDARGVEIDLIQESGKYGDSIPYISADPKHEKFLQPADGPGSPASAKPRP